MTWCRLTRRRPLRRLGLLVLLTVAACAPRLVPPGPLAAVSSADQEATLAQDKLIAADGYELPLRTWLPAGPPAAVVVAVHGFNDYSNAFTDLATPFNEAGIALYAYDQRGFGATADAGLWPGTDILVGDLRAAVVALSGRHPDAPVYVLGESMGGAVAVAAWAVDPPPVAGLILVGPAVRGRAVIPFYQQTALWLAAHAVPWLELTGRGLDITPSDNVAMLQALGADPLVIKATRIDAIWGVVDLMDRALAAAPALSARALIQYGASDEIIPPKATREFLDRLPVAAPHTVAVYPNGFHMLLRDTAAATPIADIVAWVRAPAAPLPSGAATVDAATALFGALAHD